MIELTKANYFSPEAMRDYMSVSQFKTFERCEYMGMAELRGEYVRPMTTALLVGSYVDAFFEGSLGAFRADHPEVFKRDGDLKAEYKQAEQIIDRLNRDKLFMRYMSGDAQVIMSGEIEGVPVKVKIDSYHAGKAIVDLKIMRDFAPVYVPAQGRLNFIEAWEYDLQGAVYQEIVRQNTGLTLPFFIAAATKEPVTDLAVIRVPDDQMRAQLEIFKANAPRYQLLKSGDVDPVRCERCDACKATKELTKIMTLEELNDYE